MKKDGWIRIFVTGIIGWLTVVGGGWYFMAIDNVFLAYWLGVPVIYLFVIMLICIRYFSEPEKDRVIEMLRDFIKPLISDLDGKIRTINNSLNNEAFALPIYGRIEPDYKYANVDILGNKELTWITGEVDKFNECIKTVKNTATEFRGMIGDIIEQKYQGDIMKYSKRDVESLIFYIAENIKEPAGNPNGVHGFWNKNRNELLSLREEPPLRKYVDKVKQDLNEAKRIATKLKDRLEELKDGYKIKNGIPEEAIKEKKEGNRTGSW